MATERSSNGEIIFVCDEGHCDESVNTGYTTWSYARENIKREGWYILPGETGPGPKGGEAWLHMCPAHGKAEFIARKERDNPPEKADLPWLRKKA